MFVSQKELIKISQKTNGKCFYCNKDWEEIDHLISKKKWEDWELEKTPLQGELNSIDNLFLACKKCNIAKKDSCPEDFMENGFKCWSRYARANQRIGVDMQWPSIYWGYGFDSKAGLTWNYWEEEILSKYGIK